MLNDYLILLRKYSEKTQKEAAKDANLHLTGYKAYENGSKIPDKECCELLSKMLGFNNDIFSKNGQSIYKLHHLLETHVEDTYLLDADFENSLYEQDFITEEEMLLLSLYRKLSDSDKEKLIEKIENLLQNMQKPPI